VKWESYIPPPPASKPPLTPPSTPPVNWSPAKRSALGAFKATGPNGLTGVIRCRVMPASTQTEDFEGFDIAEVHPTEAATTFAFPPLPWMGARFKWEVRDWVDPNDPTKKSKVLAKTLDQIFFQRAMTFIGTEEAKNYTLQADVLTDGSRRLKSEVGLVNQRYLITLKGNENSISISSNYERFNVTPRSRSRPTCGTCSRRASTTSRTNRRSSASRRGSAASRNPRRGHSNPPTPTAMTAAPRRLRLLPSSPKTRLHRQRRRHPERIKSSTPHAIAP
jgi:hypothetical protein